VSDLSARIGELAALPTSAPAPADVSGVIEQLLSGLEAGTLRSAELDAAGNWKAVPWVKQGILLAFRFGAMTDLSSGTFSFIDKGTIPPRRFDVAQGVRIVPGGSTSRRGTYIARGVVW
jgi:2,3,4,5-tetrahydropyridine-2-carboxylate N-succinyltransferase